MRRRLMPHQRDAFRYLMRHRHGALFMAMRTGKSAPTIRRIQLMRPKRVLIMAPNSALGGWERELNIEGETNVTYLAGPRDRRLTLLREGYIWNLLNKEGWRVVPEIANQQPVLWSRPLRLQPTPPGERLTWDAVVLDESPFIKSPQAQVTRFVLDYLRPCALHRYILTGLPNPESPFDYWTQLAFLDGRAFGCNNFWEFRSKAGEPDVHGCGWQLKPEWEPAVRAEVQERSFVCSRRDARMPETNVREVRRLDLPGELRKAYDRAERDFALEYRGTRLTTTTAAARWQWLRQMCGGFVDHKCVWNGKADELIGLLRGELRAEQVVVWFAYNQEIAHAWDHRNEIPGGVLVMTGKTPPDARRAYVRRFAAGDFRVFLIQQKVAEFGMDLSAADTAVYYSRHPALQTNAQCQDRIVHPRKANNLLHVDLSVRDSVDEDVADALIEKRWTSQRSLERHLGKRLTERSGG